MCQLSGNMIVFHADEVLLELFQFTRGTLFWDTLYYQVPSFKTLADIFMRFDGI